jgi:L-fucose isomerase-like protein
MTLNISMLAYRDAPLEIYRRGENRLKNSCERLDMELVEEDPDCLCFLTGGSERRAVDLSGQKRFLVLLAAPAANAMAAATEVLAWLHGQGRCGVLLNLDDPETASKLDRYARFIAGTGSLDGARIGLLGSPSPWLIASTSPENVLRDVLGLELVKLPWDGIPPLDSFPPDERFLEIFAGLTESRLVAESRVYAALKSLVEQHRLEGITVECFPMARDMGVTACLALSLLNAGGFPAACEGDLASLAGMMLVRAGTGVIPWMANTVEVRLSRVLVAHCTAPLNLVDSPSVMTHYETDSSSALRGNFQGESVTVLRLDRVLERAFIAIGRVTDRPRLKEACRTQLEIDLDQKDLRLLRERPLGNHLLILPGEHEDMLRLACEIYKIHIL